MYVKVLGYLAKKFVVRDKTKSKGSYPGPGTSEIIFPSDT